MNKLSIVGCGFVGMSLYNGMSPCFDIRIYDKFKKGYHTLKETVNHSHFIFVCVPTPMNDDGSQDLSNLNDAIKSIVKIAKDKRKIIIIKSTVLPGTTRQLSKEYYQHGFVFNPEFLTERTALLDFINSNRIILGGSLGDTLLVKELYRVRFPHTPIFRTDFEQAELVKYVGNCFFALKVSFMNEIYDICDHLDIGYEEIKKLFLADGRVANSHMDVPGPDGHRGFGGKCFPKDLNGFIKWCDDNNLECDTLKSAETVNNRVRVKKDWLDIKGATSKNNFC